MNRLYHLKETLPMNLADNIATENIEFVILDYNSTDGLEDWVQQNFDQFCGKVAYFRTTQPTFYNRSHSRNMAFRLASGNIVCNLDADNYAGKGFAEYLTAMFQQHNSIFIAPQNNNLSDTFGKISTTKSDFLQIRGYDEAIKGYGFEDNDLKNRLTNLGRTEATFNDTEFLKAITHTEEERIKNEFIYNHLQAIFVENLSYWQSKLTILYKDNTYESAQIIDSMYSNPSIEIETIRPLEFLNRYYILEDSIEKGLFNEDLVANATVVTKQETLISTINFYSQLSNKLRFMDNFHNKRTTVNDESFGSGIVYKNFDYTNPIILA
ncbi:glycosyltransferase family 2 protein [Emticicia aquatilis]|nr:glycosyltransferase family A protein [Emticicia aquatilis]